MAPPTLDGDLVKKWGPKMNITQRKHMLDLVGRGSHFLEHSPIIKEVDIAASQPSSKY